jgi:hypothetical protein
MAATLLAALALSGCSMSIPGFVDKTPTGSVRPPTYPFAQEDWDKAQPAVLAAIRAEDGEDPASWSNDASGHKGMVIGIGARITRNGSTCRAIVARILEGDASRTAQGDACEKAGAVTLTDAAPLKGV